jgi:MYXO-CTERM domain-containing protein
MFSSTRNGLAFVLVFALPTIAAAAPAIGLSDDGTALIPFDLETPGDFDDSIDITGLPAGVELLAIDAQPSTGDLYALGDNSRLYKITAAGVASAVGDAFATALDYDDFVGFDFNPVSGQIRIATDKNQNLRFNLATNAVTKDTDFVYANAALGLLRVASPMDLTGVAYSPAVAGATSFYAIDANNKELVQVTAITPPDFFQVTPIPEPAAGVLGGNTLGIDPGGNDLGFDIAPDGTAYVVTTDDDDDEALYSLSLTTGVVTRVDYLESDLRDFTIVITPEENPDAGTSSSSSSGSSGEDGGTTSSSSGGSSGTTSSSGGSSGASSSSSGASGTTSSSSGTSGASSSSGTGGTGDGGVDQGLGVDGLTGGDGCSITMAPSSAPWGAGLFAAAFGLVVARLRRRNK